MTSSDGEQVRARGTLDIIFLCNRHLRPECQSLGYDSGVYRTSDFSRGNQLSRASDGRIEPALQSDCRVERVCRIHHLFSLRDAASERRLAVDCLARLQRCQNEFAVCGHIHRYGNDIDLIITNHREGIAVPAISAEGLGGLPRTLLVTSCHSREPKAGQIIYRRNVRHLRPAAFRGRADDTNTDFTFSSGNHWLSPTSASPHTSSLLKGPLLQC